MQSELIFVFLVRYLINDYSVCIIRLLFTFEFLARCYRVLVRCYRYLINDYSVCIVSLLFTFEFLVRRYRVLVRCYRVLILNEWYFSKKNYIKFRFKN